jgi:hypothetical protein
LTTRETATTAHLAQPGEHHLAELVADVAPVHHARRQRLERRLQDADLERALLRSAADVGELVGRLADGEAGKKVGGKLLAAALVRGGGGGRRRRRSASRTRLGQLVVDLLVLEEGVQRFVELRVEGHDLLRRLGRVDVPGPAHCPPSLRGCS